MNGSDTLPAHLHTRILLFHRLTHSLHCQKIRPEALLCLIHEHDPNVPGLSLFREHIIERIQIIAVVRRQRKILRKAPVKLFSVPYPRYIYFEFHIPHTFRSASDRSTFLPDFSGSSFYGCRLRIYSDYGYRLPICSERKQEHARSYSSPYRSSKVS